MKNFGREFALDPTVGRLERLYIRMVGNPVLGMRIRSRAILALLQEYRATHPTPPRRIGDAGCGRGMFTFYLARLFEQAQVIGYDLDRAALQRNRQIAQRANLHTIQFIYQDISTLHVDEPLDLLLSTDCLEHVQDDRAQIQRFSQLLSDGGELLVHVPHLTRTLFGWKRTNFMGIEGHVRPGYTRAQLTELATEAGLQIRRLEYSYGSWETLANDIAYLITGGRERNKALYALLLPFLIGLTLPDAGHPYCRHQGSGLVMLATKGGQ
jgi:cyclopropane fatty-acyl-phospholipid synthase-like methyltransferase